tara:strand:- start:12404 stop:12787 length:384 start_codon:yes stop_codon:yes gene_type:complete
MATPLNKAVHRVVELNGEEFIASLEPSLEFTLRKKRHKAVIRQKMESLIKEPEPAFTPDTLTVAPKGVRRTTHARVMATDPAWTAEEIKAKLAIADIDYKLKVEVLKAVEDLLAIDREIDESRTMNL